MHQPSILTMYANLIGLRQRPPVSETAVEDDLKFLPITVTQFLKQIGPILGYDNHVPLHLPTRTFFSVASSLSSKRLTSLTLQSASFRIVHAISAEPSSPAAICGSAFRSSVFHHSTF